MNETNKEELNKTKNKRIEQNKEQKKERKKRIVRDSLIDTNDTIIVLYVLMFAMTLDWQEEELLPQEDCKTNIYLLQRPHIHKHPPNSSRNSYHRRHHPIIAAIDLYFQET